MPPAPILPICISIFAGCAWLRRRRKGRSNCRRRALRWNYDGKDHATELAGLVLADDMAAVLHNNGFAASLESQGARFATDLQWPGTPARFHGSRLSGQIDLLVEDGRFLETNAGGGALKLISIINFDAIMRRLRLSDDLLRPRPGVRRNQRPPEPGPRSGPNRGSTRDLRTVQSVSDHGRSGSER